MSGSILIDQSDEDLKQTFIGLGLVTASDRMIPILRKASRAATVSDVTVLIDGETGTGKQILARVIHYLDEKRRTFPFITAHCSTIGESIAESEMFGHRRGAFTGSSADRPGLFQAAHRGTLFLDDVNDLPMSIQPKLLDVMQRGVLRRIGSDKGNEGRREDRRCLQSAFGAAGSAKALSTRPLPPAQRNLFAIAAT